MQTERKNNKGDREWKTEVERQSTVRHIRRLEKTSDLLFKAMTQTERERYIRTFIS